MMKTFAAVADATAEAFRRYQDTHENRRVQHELSVTAAELARANYALQASLAEQSLIAAGASASLRDAQATLQNISIPLLGVDADGTIANASAEAYFGDGRGPLLGRYARESLPTALRASHHALADNSSDSSAEREADSSAIESSG